MAWRGCSPRQPSAAAALGGAGPRARLALGRSRWTWRQRWGLGGGGFGGRVGFVAVAGSAAVAVSSMAVSSRCRWQRRSRRRVAGSASPPVAESASDSVSGRRPTRSRVGGGLGLAVGWRTRSRRRVASSASQSRGELGLAVGGRAGVGGVGDCLGSRGSRVQWKRGALPHLRRMSHRVVAKALRIPKLKFKQRGMGTGRRAVSGASESAWSAGTRRSQAGRRSLEVCCASVVGMSAIRERPSQSRAATERSAEQTSR